LLFGHPRRGQRNPLPVLALIYNGRLHDRSPRFRNIMNKCGTRRRHTQMGGVIF